MLNHYNFDTSKGDTNVSNYINVSNDTYNFKPIKKVSANSKFACVRKESPEAKSMFLPEPFIIEKVHRRTYFINPLDPMTMRPVNTDTYDVIYALINVVQVQCIKDDEMIIEYEILEHKNVVVIGDYNSVEGSIKRGLYYMAERDGAIVVNKDNERICLI